MTTQLDEIIQGLSPAALKIFKQQLQQRGLGDNTALSQMQGMPQFQSAPIEQELSWWQKPLKWLGEQEEKFGSIVTSPFTPSVGREDLPWFQRELAEYRGWDEPSFQVKPPFRLPWTPEEIRNKPWNIGVKGAVETLPWFATTILTGGVGGLGWLAGKTGIQALKTAAAIGSRAIKPALAVERAIAYPLTKPLGIVAKKLIPSQLPETARFIAPASELIEKTITKNDWQRRIAQMFGRKPFLKSITEKIGGRAATVTEAVEDTTARALLVGVRVQETLASKGQVALATLGKIHQNPVRLFGVDEITGIAGKVKPRVKGTSLHIADIAEHPKNYILTAEQTAYIQQVHTVEDWVLDGLKEAGVKINQLKFDSFSHWVHREVIGKNIDEALIKLSKGGGRIGAKAGFTKTRFYETAAEGVKAGVLYEPSLERVTELYIQSAAKMISDTRIAQMVAQFGEKPLERAMKFAPEVLETAKATTRTLAGARQLVKVINRAARGEKLTEATLKAQEARFPELTKRLRDILGDEPAIKQLAKEAKQIEEAARAPFWKAKAERAGVMERARTPTLGTEATIWHPAFQGKIYPKNIAGEIQRYWDDQGFSPLNKLATISGEMRTLVAAADFSAPWIQGVTGAALHPTAWGKGVNVMFRAFKNPRVYDDYLVKNVDNLMERAHYGGYVGGFEFMEAMPQLQKSAAMLTRLAGKPEVGRTAIRQTYGRFEAAFGSFGDAFRNEMWSVLKVRAKNPDELMEIARHIDRMSGVMSSKGLGLGKTQRSFEQAFLFFAPRYTRAGFAMVGDMFKGGLSGAEARKALGSMMAAGGFMYAGISKALGQEPNFDPTTGKFMTIEITDPITGTTRHFGIGGMMTSLMRFGADVTASALSIGQNEPLDFVKLSRFDNPFMKFMFSKSAPLTGFMEGMVFGHNYFGEPFENVGDYAMFMGEQVMPIALQASLMEEGGLAPTAIAAEELGMRTFPRSDWEKRDNVRDRLSMEKYGVSWDELGTGQGRLYQEQLLRDNPELQEATERASESSSKMARGEGKVWDMWKKEGKAVEERYRESVMISSREFEYTGDGTTFREKVDEANAVKRAMYAQREKDPVYTEIQEFFNEPLETTVGINPKDLARREYYQMMYSPDMYDQFGNYKFEEADKRERYFIQKYGQSVLDYVEEYMGAKWEEPQGMRMLRSAREILQPYWEIENRIWANYDPQLKQIAQQISIIERTNPQQAKMMLYNYPQIVMARRMISLYKKQFKAMNPQVAQALNTFYRY